MMNHSLIWGRIYIYVCVCVFVYVGMVRVCCVTFATYSFPFPTTGLTGILSICCILMLRSDAH